MSKIEQIKIPVEIRNPKYMLHRLNDNLKIPCFVIKFLEFNKDNQGLKLHDKPKVDYSCLCDYNDYTFNWQTTQITEVISDVEFKTRNSHYKILNYGERI